MVPFSKCITHILLCALRVCIRVNWKVKCSSRSEQTEFNIIAAMKWNEKTRPHKRAIHQEFYVAFMNIKVYTKYIHSCEVIA